MGRGTQASPKRDDEGLEDFAAARRTAFGIAYRILRNAADAEDVVQETWLRWQRCDRSSVHDPSAFLSRTARNLALNELACARARHEVLTAHQPMAPTAENDPAALFERDAALEQAAILLTQRLAPTARAAFVLRVGFDYPYERIARLVDTSAVGARQLVSRARHELLRPPAPDPHTHATPDAAQRHLVRELVYAARSGDLRRLEILLRREIGLAVHIARRAGRRPAAG
ncbi:sigma-70 family RNA polymerase sigma factor [Microbacterium terrisoli]|jgi:RNA polymerase sigma-70 factor (ECF subfamily)|uniref:sigma-70 family RNA polymerase sigma factor n=1 Tax=Microbacterium terrisoli TaxID=3242192 RepID=UPI0028062D72|nr:sigma-70 family RNA polymerase sigma factor [Microbacterium protaetiae]